MDCRYLEREEDRIFCQLKNSQITRRYVRRVCAQYEDSETCIKAVETLQEADRLAKDNNISYVTLFREASLYFTKVEDYLKAIISRIKLITFLKKHNYYEQAIAEAKEVKQLYNDALKTSPSLRSSAIGEKIASLEQSLQVAYNQSIESGGLVKPSAVLQTISEIHIEEAVGHAKRNNIEKDIEQEIEKAIETEVQSEYPSPPVSELPETIPKIEISGSTEISGAIEEFTTADETITTKETVKLPETETKTDVGGTIESVETIEEADSSMGFLSHYADKAERYEGLVKTQILEGSLEKAAKYTALSTISWILAGNPQEGLMTLNRLLKESKGKRENVKKEPIFVIARSLILASFNKDMGKYYEAELLIRQLKNDFSDEEMDLIGQGLKTIKEMIE